MTLRLTLLLAAALALAACGRGPGKPDKGAAAPPTLLVTPEDLHTVGRNAIASGPAVTGSVQPEKRADLRAEVAGIVLQVARENGDVVRRGDLLVRLDDTSIRDALASAESANRTAVQALEQAERQLQRLVTLRGSGMASAQQLEDMEVRRNNAATEVEASRTRVVQARQQLQRTEVRAPFDGIVSDRKVSAGDTAQVGKELLKVIDPASMRFEGLISADHVGTVKVGQPVSFRVSGYGEQEFAGKVRRVNPSANPTTRQIEVLVDFAGPKQPQLAGLYAEGRIEVASETTLTLAASAIVRDGDRTSAWRVANNKLERVTLALGPRDPRTGDFAIASGLAEGDRVIRYPTALLKDGQPVEAKAASAPATPAAPAAAVPVQPTPAAEPAAAPAALPARQSWMDRLKAGLRKTGSSIATVFTGTQIDDNLYEELETALLMADTGVKATEQLLADLKRRVKEAKATDPAQVKGLLADAIADLLAPLQKPLEIGGQQPTVIMVAGVNGAGKTTSIGKLTKHLADSGESVLLAAADTFRAAAKEQLAVWADRNTVEIVSQQGGDPAAVSFDAVSAGRARGKDVVLVDTAGRLPTQLHLMEELKKIKRVVQKADATAPHEVLLVIDGNTGQNALAQVKAFDEALQLTGLIVTKLDGTAKGGVLCAIAREKPIPVYFIGVGEKLEDLETFDAREFAQALLS